MLQIGKINSLKVVDELPFGFYLDGHQVERILLPTSSAPQGCEVGQTVDVFIYHDSDDRIIANSKIPFAMVDEIAVLKVKSLTRVGAFLDWGLEKDLLVPFSEQEKPMEEGLLYVVYVFQDPETQRLAASTKLREFLHEDGHDLEPKSPVDLIICGRTDMGYKAVINGTYLGLIFKDEVFKPLRIGEKIKGYIKHIREDGKIDLALQLHNDQSRKELTEQIIEDLEAHGGFSTLTDKSPPEEISQRFGVSKNTYKKALGALFKQKRILLDKQKVTLVQK
ncbi:S1-like domain-containing RNA-binding protein [Aliiglaciecola sp. LCG003]|uniref:CvfB family protein n=1 Tax=Aliiglaciecola sp. LCG003 TaxID=3053655 RepID=UPI002573FAF6|nr:S1-like domain-containing RNA-binding protein [Aliiglaciecola sp. LCG003]WJG11047.1 S1-like domain-containing RNA-binding protein [Aliiglaciecola sp. LCG003]